MAQLTADQLVQLARQSKGKSPVDLGQSSTTIGVDGEEIPKKSTQLTADQLVAMAKQQQANFKPFDWKASQKESMTQAAKDAGKTQAWESGLLGFSDLGAGVVQGATYAADGISGVLNKLLGTNLDTKSYERFTKERKDIEDLHNLRREANDQGFDGFLYVIKLYYKFLKRNKYNHCLYMCFFYQLIIFYLSKCGIVYLLYQCEN
ncbi:MAG: hypothetical protein GAK29_04468 [Acinetobacter bereziniae]|uniref:Uncharacterized protein n=1 Tax=Acinetobacter bereziniae TaxID=106648 RepID=A0A833PB58_ACIBZ|nr:MAG: hypothetical protein GAK29_04468 [Acinetobacter bereziniae]